MGQLLHLPAVSNMCKHDQQIIFEQPLLPKQTMLSFHALLTFSTLRLLRQSNRFTLLILQAQTSSKTANLCTYLRHM